MKVKLNKQSEKYLDKTSGKTYDKLQKALKGLETLTGDIKALEGVKDTYRLKTPPYRIIFTVDGETIKVKGIHPRGDAYKKG